MAFFKSFGNNRLTFELTGLGYKTNFSEENEDEINDLDPTEYKGGTIEEFKNVYSMIETCVIALINKSKEF